MAKKRPIRGRRAKPSSSHDAAVNNEHPVEVEGFEPQEGAEVTEAEGFHTPEEPETAEAHMEEPEATPIPEQRRRRQRRRRSWWEIIVEPAPDPTPDLATTTDDTREVRWVEPQRPRRRKRSWWEALVEPAPDADAPAEPQFFDLEAAAAESLVESPAVDSEPDRSPDAMGGDSEATFAEAFAESESTENIDVAEPLEPEPFLSEAEALPPKPERWWRRKHSEPEAEDRTVDQVAEVEPLGEEEQLAHEPTRRRSRRRQRAQEAEMPEDASAGPGELEVIDPDALGEDAARKRGRRRRRKAREPAAQEAVVNELEDDTAPEAVEPEAFEPEAVEPEAFEPEAVEPEAVEPEAVEPEAVEPEAVEPEAVEPEAVEPEAVEPEAVEPEAVEPEAVEPEAVEPEPQIVDDVSGEAPIEAIAGPEAIEETTTEEGATGQISELETLSSEEQLPEIPKRRRRRHRKEPAEEEATDQIGELEALPVAEPLPAKPTRQRRRERRKRAAEQEATDLIELETAAEDKLVEEPTRRRRRRKRGAPEPSMDAEAFFDQEPVPQPEPSHWWRRKHREPEAEIEVAEQIGELEALADEEQSAQEPKRRRRRRKRREAAAQDEVAEQLGGVAGPVEEEQVAEEPKRRRRRRKRHELEALEPEPEIVDDASAEAPIEAIVEPEAAEPEAAEPEAAEPEAAEPEAAEPEPLLIDEEVPEKPTRWWRRKRRAPAAEMEAAELVGESAAPVEEAQLAEEPKRRRRRRKRHEFEALEPEIVDDASAEAPIEAIVEPEPAEPEAAVEPEPVEPEAVEPEPLLVDEEVREQKPSRWWRRKEREPVAEEETTEQVGEFADSVEEEQLAEEGKPWRRRVRLGKRDRAGIEPEVVAEVEPEFLEAELEDEMTTRKGRRHRRRSIWSEPPEPTATPEIQEAEGIEEPQPEPVEAAYEEEDSFELAAKPTRRFWRRRRARADDEAPAEEVDVDVDAGVETFETERAESIEESQPEPIEAAYEEEDSYELAAKPTRRFWRRKRARTDDLVETPAEDIDVGAGVMPEAEVEAESAEAEIAALVEPEPIEPEPEAVPLRRPEPFGWQLEPVGPRAVALRERRKRRQRARITSAGIIAVSLCISVGIWAVYREDDQPNQSPAPLLALETEEDAVTVSLLFGTREEDSPGRGSAAWISLLSLNAATGRGSVIYIPAHTAVEVPGRGLNDLGGTLASGGVPLLLVTTENLLGVEIDRYVELSDKDAQVLFDAMGGLSVDIPSEVTVPAGRDQARLLFAAGRQQLSGRFLVDLLYTIGLEEGDIDLGVRHLAFWDAIFDQFGETPSALGNSVRAADAALGESDAEVEEHAVFVEALALLPNRDRDVAMLPVSQVSVGGSELYEVDPVQIAQFVSDKVGAAVTPSDEVRVQVLNGNGVPGIGVKVAQRLVGEGFRVILGGNATELDYEETLIVTYDSSTQAQRLAERARDLLGVGEVQVSVQQQGIVDLTIVVGKDFLRTL